MRRAFTLIELLVAVMILGLVLMFLTQTLSTVRTNNEVLNSAYHKHTAQTKALKLLQADVVQSEGNVTVINGGDKFDALVLETYSTVYGINRPYVRWFIDKKTKRIIRSESAIDLLPPFQTNDLHRVHVDAVFNECQWFHVYQKKGALLVAMQCEKRPQPIVLEILQFSQAKQ